MLRVGHFSFQSGKQFVVNIQNKYTQVGLDARDLKCRIQSAGSLIFCDFEHATV
jgi:hypothetical protein